MTVQPPPPPPPDVSPPPPPDVSPPPPPGTASVPVATVQFPMTGVPRTVEELRDLRARRSELSDQLQSAASRRNAVATRLRAADGADRAGLEQRLQLLDQRILQLENDIAATGQQLAATPANLLGRSSSTAMPPRMRENFRERTGVAVGSLFTLLVLAPLALSAARMMWRRSTQPAQRDPETTQRLMRLESAVDTIAVEIERVSEGQRFLTRLLAEPNGTARLDALPQHDPVARAASAPTADIRLDRA